MNTGMHWGRFPKVRRQCDLDDGYQNAIIITSALMNFNRVQDTVENLRLEIALGQTRPILGEPREWNWLDRQSFEGLSACVEIIRFPSWLSDGSSWNRGTLGSSPQKWGKIRKIGSRILTHSTHQRPITRYHYHCNNPTQRSPENSFMALVQRKKYHSVICWRL